MDALKQIASECIKAEMPKVEIGDTVKVHVWIKEGEKKRVQVFEGTVWHMAAELRGFSRSTPPISKRWIWSAKAVSAAASSTICVTALVRLPRSRTSSANLILMQKSSRDFCGCFSF